MTRVRMAVLAAGVLLAACSAPPDERPPDHGAGAATACGTADLRLVLPTEIYGAVAAVLSDAGCTHVRLDRLAGPEAREDPGDLWIDDQRWTAGASEVAVVATSPLVLVSRGRPCGRTWPEVVRSDRLRLGDPLVDSAALLTLALGVGDRAVSPVARTVQAGFRRDPTRARAVMVERVEDVASREFGPGGCTVATEQAVLRDGRSARVSVPAPATVALSYRLVAPGNVPPDAEAVAAVLTSAAARPVLAQALLRPPDGSAVAGGVGDVTLTDGPDRAALERAEAGWVATADR